MEGSPCTLTIKNSKPSVFMSVQCHLPIGLRVLCQCRVLPVETRSSELIAHKHCKHPFTQHGRLTSLKAGKKAGGLFILVPIGKNRMPAG